MKTQFSSLLVALVCLLFSFGAKAQTTYTAGDISATVSYVHIHDSTNCRTNFTITYDIAINNSFVGDSVKVVDTVTGALVYSAINTAGLLYWTMSIPIGTQFEGDENLISGNAIYTRNINKIVSGTDTCFVTFHDTCAVTDPCAFSNISGKVYVDNNDNCIYDAGDSTLNFTWILGSSYVAGGPVFPQWDNVSFAGLTGAYSINILQSWMTNCTVVLPPWYDFIFPVSSCFSGPYNFTTLPQANIDFPLQCTHMVDVECWAGTPANARPARPFFLHPYVSNTGCSPISGQLTLVKDSRVIYDALLSTNPPTIIIGDTLVWDYSNLSNISNGAYWNNFMSSIHLTPNTTVNIGDTLCFRIFTGVPATDINPANNDYTICLPVVNSYDPNIKEVSPTGVGPTGEIGASTPELEYTIHFQNTGTAFAYDVSVIDTLSPNVDAASLKILGTSHTMLPEWIAPGVVKFKFANIFLADSFSNEPASHGYVRFKVKMHSGLTPGTQIKNKGYIYFDTNPPVITNEALNTIIHTVSVPAVATPVDVKIYPNPATENIFVENLQNGQLSILSINGAVVLNQNIANNKTEIDISRLPAGVYILKTVCKDGASTRKFVKE